MLMRGIHAWLKVVVNGIAKSQVNAERTDITCQTNFSISSTINSRDSRKKSIKLVKNCKNLSPLVFKKLLKLILPKSLQLELIS